MVNLAMVGCGKMAARHAENLQVIAECKVIALCDSVPGNIADFQTRFFPNAVGFDSLEKLLAAPPEKLDGIVLVTPHSLHHQQCKMALEAGVNVLVEKPMVTNSEHAYDLWRTVNKTGKLLAISFQSPYSEVFQYLAAARDRGDLGSFKLINGWLSQSWWHGKVGGWRHDPKISGGGQMYDSGSHLLNAFMWLNNSPVIEVGCFYDKAGAPVDINGVAIMKFENGCMGSVAIGGSCPADFQFELTIQTDTQLIKTDQYGKSLEVYGYGGKRIYPHVPQQLNVAAAGTVQLNFVNAIIGKEKPPSTVRNGVLLSALMDAMYESAHTQSMVKVKPVPKELP
jgi:predicted dehydrogenase